MNATSAPFGSGIDEATALDVEMAPSTVVNPPRIAPLPESLECTLRQIHETGDSMLVIGEVAMLTVDDQVFVDGEPDYDPMRPVARLGGPMWGLPSLTVALPRPMLVDYA